MVYIPNSMYDEPWATKDVHLITYFGNRTSQINGSAAGPKTGIWRLLWQKLGKNRVVCLARGTWLVPHVIYFDSDMRFSSCFD